MTLSLQLREHAVVLAIPHFSPAALTLEMLHYSGCVPSDWELLRPPTYTQQVTQFLFQNGVSLTAYPERLVFAEDLYSKTIPDVLMPQLAHKYVASFPHAHYRAIGINFQGMVPLAAAQPDAARQFVSGLLAPGAWQTFGQAPVQAALTCSYTLDACRLQLAISPAALRLPEDKTIPVVTFAANFDYSVTGNSLEERLSQLLQAIAQWQSNLETYQELVNTRFLNQTNDITPIPEPFVAGIGVS